MTTVFVNIPVSDVKRSTAFYTSLGFVQNKDYSSEDASAMVWDDHFVIMLLSRKFYRQFIKDKEIADTRTTSGALISFSLESPAAVDKLVKAARENGGDVYKVDMGVPEDTMYGFELQDPDGNILEPSWMKR